MSMLLLIYGHFMRQTPFSLLVLPSYAWRTEGREKKVLKIGSQGHIVTYNFFAPLL